MRTHIETPVGSQVTAGGSVGVGGSGRASRGGEAEPGGTGSAAPPCAAPPDPDEPEPELGGGLAGVGANPGAELGAGAPAGAVSLPALLPEEPEAEQTSWGTQSKPAPQSAATVHGKVQRGAQKDAVLVVHEDSGGTMSCAGSPAPPQSVFGGQSGTGVVGAAPEHSTSVRATHFWSTPQSESRAHGAGAQ